MLTGRQLRFAGTMLEMLAHEPPVALWLSSRNAAVYCSDHPAGECPAVEGLMVRYGGGIGAQVTIIGDGHHHIVQRMPLTIRPSIIAGCGPNQWHGYITDGRLTHHGG